MRVCGGGCGGTTGRTPYGDEAPRRQVLSGSRGSGSRGSGSGGTGSSGTGSEDWPPQVLREYALLADGERGALVGPDGAITWLCFPRWDSPAVFAAIIGGGGGYRVSPTERHVWGGRYERGGLVWVSRWVTDDGVVESRDALSLPGRGDQAVLLRSVTAHDAPTRIRVLLDLRADFGSLGMRDLRLDDDGRWHATAGDVTMCWLGAPEATVATSGRHRRLVAELELAAGETRDLVLVLAQPGDLDVPDAEVAWAATAAGWGSRVPDLPGCVGRRDARHAYAVLSGLTSPGGGMVAAATTSLPERARQGRNYDYRYVWIRDQCFAGQAVAPGPDPTLLDSAVTFVRDRLLADGPALAPAYTVSGGRVPDQRQLGLPGYPGAQDLVGNWVNKQFQLDAFGEALLLFAAAGRLDRLDADSWRAAEVAVAAITDRWTEPDAGIWELDNAAWTHSRLQCAAGLRAVAQLPVAGHQAGSWAGLADRIVADTSAHALHPTGRWQRTPDDPRVDAALLLPALRGGLAPSDPRTLATLAAVEHDLTQDGFAYRFRHGDQPLGQAEGAFLLCGFLMSLTYLQQGDLVEAARWFERNRASCGPPGLLTEEWDVSQRQLRGNAPQAFVHALMLECALRQT